MHSTNTMMLQTVEQAHDKAAALGKALYSQLFLWLVAKLNTTISAPQRYIYPFRWQFDVHRCTVFSEPSAVLAYSISSTTHAVSECPTVQGGGRKSVDFVFHARSVLVVDAAFVAAVR